MFIEIFADFTFLHQNIEVPRKHWMLTILGPASLCHLQSVLTNLIACMFRALTWHVFIAAYAGKVFCYVAYRAMSRAL